LADVLHTEVVPTLATFIVSCFVWVWGEVYHCKLQVFRNEVLRKIYWPQKVTVSW